jgi:hypothetical protein
MATPTTAEMEKVVRKVLDEELGDDSEATLKGIQRVTRLLTDQVIPKLSDGSEEEEPVPTKPSALRVRGVKPTPGKPGPGKPGKPEIPDKPGEPEIPDKPGEPGMPDGGMEALEELRSTLSPEQFNALASFFTTISSEPDEEEGETGEGGIGAKFSVSDVSKRKPAEFQAAVDALTPYVVEEEDGTFSFNAPKRVIRELDEDVYADLTDSLEQANEIMRGAPAGAVGARGIKIPWGLVWRMVKRFGKRLPWYKIACATAVVIRNRDRYPGDPPQRRWLEAAARNVIASCL